MPYFVVEFDEFWPGGIEKFLEINSKSHFLLKESEIKGILKKRKRR